MGFNLPTMWMRKGWVTDTVTVTYEPFKEGVAVNQAALQLLLPSAPISPPNTQTVPASFAVAVVANTPGAPLQLQVTFGGVATLWYIPFLLRRQVKIPVNFGPTPENPPAFVNLNADSLQVMLGNPALYPLSVDGQFKFFPDGNDCKAGGIDPGKLDPADLEFYSLDLQHALPLNAKGGLELPKGARLPSELARRPFLVEIRTRDEQKNMVRQGVVPVQVHAASDLIVMFDRSRSMKGKWPAVREAASLLAEIYGGALTPLKTPAGVRMLDEQRIAFGHFDVQEHCPRTIIAPLRAASGDKPMLLEEAAGGGSGAAIGDALVTAQHFFGEGSHRRRRHIVLLTDSTDVGTARPLSELGPRILPRLADDPERGVSIHQIAFGATGEAQSADLYALSRAYGGEFHDSSSERDPLDPDGLQSMVLSALSAVLPIERLELRGGGQVATKVALEDGTRRAIFVARNGADLRVTHQGRELGKDALRKTAAFTLITVDQPEPGVWDVQAAADARVTVLLESALRMRCGVSQRGLGEAITVWAELAHGIEPVRGAELHGSVALPDESLGELLTELGQSGALPGSCRGGHLERRLYGPGGPLASARALLTVTPQRKDRMSLRPEDDEPGVGDEPRSPQRALLDAVERRRGLPFQTRRKALTWVEVRPGRYEARLSGAEAGFEGTYAFSIQARGCTPDGFAFERSQRATTVLAPIPDAQRSACWIEESGKPLPDRTRNWLATFQPRTRAGKPLGPGLVRNLHVQYSDEARERGERLRVLDNLDGTYSVRCDSKLGAPAPGLVLSYRLAGTIEPVALVPLRAGGRGGKHVRVILKELRIADPRDRCLPPDPDAKTKDARLLKLDAIVAINGNANRARRTRVLLALAAPPDPHCAIELSRVLFEGHVEPGAALDITLGEPDFDWLQLLHGRPRETRHRQVFRLVEHAQGTHAVPLFAELAPPGQPQWQVSLAVEVE